jgi:hypothetical protein
MLTHLHQAQPLVPSHSELHFQRRPLASLVLSRQRPRRLMTVSTNYRSQATRQNIFSDRDFWFGNIGRRQGNGCWAWTRNSVAQASRWRVRHVEDSAVRLIMPILWIRHNLMPWRKGPARKDGGLCLSGQAVDWKRMRLSMFHYAGFSDGAIKKAWRC